MQKILKKLILLSIASNAFPLPSFAFDIPCSEFSPKIFQGALAKTFSEVDPTVEYWENAYCQTDPSKLFGNGCRYYGDNLSDYDLKTSRYQPSRVNLGKSRAENGNVGTNRTYEDYQERLSLDKNQILSAKGQKWLSVGEGQSNFTYKAIKKGIDAWSVDAAVVNQWAPQRSILALAQKLPFPAHTFDRVLSDHRFFGLFATIRLDPIPHEPTG